jgi:hypothetical protein
MELSGSLMERPVTIGNSSSRSFIVSHGDGDLTTTNSDWPSLVYRGGSWIGGADVRASARQDAAYIGPNRYSDTGARCARTADVFSPPH